MSVIVPTHNRSNLLRRALRSLQGQTYRPLEVVVIDDGSTDDTASIAELGHPNVVYRRQRNRGAPAARNLGMELASGRYLAFLDSDDEYLAEKVARQVKFLRQQPDNVVAVECGTLVVSDRGTRRVPSSLGDGTFADLLCFRYGSGMMPTFLYRRAAVEGLRFDEKLPAYQDFEFVLQVLKRGDVAWDDEAMVRVHEHAGDRVTEPSRHLAAVTMLMDRYRRDIEHNEEALAAWHWKLARLNMTVGNVALAAQHFRASAGAVPHDRNRQLLRLASFGEGAVLPAAWEGYQILARLRHRLGAH